MGASIIDVSSWEERPYQTEGTREKSVLINRSDSREYHLKTSFKKGKKDYTFEFWSEVIASKVGLHLGFQVADYNVGIRREHNDKLTVGALVASVHDDTENLISGYNLIIQYFPDFSRNFKKGHTLELIKETLTAHNLSSYFSGILECMVFDAIIGNTDRHSENWAFIVTKEYFLIQKRYSILKKTHSILKREYSILKKNPRLRRSTNQSDDVYREIERHLKNLEALIKDASPLFMRLSPLYDNGSSLGREISEKKVRSQSDNDIDKYIDKGTPDIRVNPAEKTSFLDTIASLRDSYPNEMANILERLQQRYQKTTIELIVTEIDQEPGIEQIPQEHLLSKERKEFIIKIITKRIERIIEIGKSI